MLGQVEIKDKEEATMVAEEPYSRMALLESYQLAHANHLDMCAKALFMPPVLATQSQL